MVVCLQTDANQWGQRTTLETRFLLSTLWVPGINFQSSGLVARTAYADKSLQAKFPFSGVFQISCYSNKKIWSTSCSIQSTSPSLSPIHNHAPKYPHVPLLFPLTQCPPVHHSTGHHTPVYLLIYLPAALPVWLKQRDIQRVSSCFKDQLPDIDLFDGSQSLSRRTDVQVSNSVRCPRNNSGSHPHKRPWSDGEAWVATYRSVCTGSA